MTPPLSPADLLCQRCGQPYGSMQFDTLTGVAYHLRCPPGTDGGSQPLPLGVPFTPDEATARGATPRLQAGDVGDAPPEPPR